MRTIWIIIPGNRVNGRVTRELFESNPCVVHYAPERGGCAFVLRFVSLFTPSSSRFVVASLLVFLTRPLSSLTTTLDTLSLLSYPTRKGLLFKFERFFFFLPPQGRIQDTAPLRLMITRRFDADRTDTRADEYLIWYRMWILEGNGSFEWIQLWWIRENSYPSFLRV